MTLKIFIRSISDMVVDSDISQKLFKSPDYNGHATAWAIGFVNNM